MGEDVFLQYGAYYDLLYRDKDYTAEAEYVARTLRAANPAVKTVLEFGSGTGKHGRLLAGQGFHVFGVERSESMVAVARNVNVALHPAPGYTQSCLGNFDCMQGDIQALELQRTFDAVISLFHVVSYQSTNDGLHRTFANAARHLPPEGVFLFDVWHGPAVLRERPLVRVKRVEDENVRLTRIAEPELDTNAGVVTVRYTMLAEAKSDGRLTTLAEEHHMRYLFRSEVDFLATQAGFEVERSEEFLTGQAASESTWGVAYLLRKPA